MAITDNSAFEFMVLRFDDLQYLEDTHKTHNAAISYVNESQRLLLAVKTVCLVLKNKS